MSEHIADVLARGDRLVYTTTGTSMLPMLRQKRDLVVLEPPRGRLRRYDVALYRDGEDRYILHRVVGQDPDGYVLRGDHNWTCERGIAQERVIGVLTAFVRDGRQIPVTDARYRLYVRVWCGSFRLRAAVRRLLALPGGAVRKWRRAHER